ncbi:hypothetical protein HAX54_030720 [Datura stramonium]|uniref:Uncharacterized protein n=1 Tax=Datura stramonium TaxID=4076 RepID=A0ABS8SBH4_DATST|nr:hypothetical protein [Datura stramonium]
MRDRQLLSVFCLVKSPKLLSTLSKSTSFLASLSTQFSLEVPSLFISVNSSAANSPLLKQRPLKVLIFVTLQFHTSYIGTFMMYMELLIMISLADDKGVHEVNLDAE